MILRGKSTTRKCTFLAILHCWSTLCRQHRFSPVHTPRPWSHVMIDTFLVILLCYNILCRQHTFSPIHITYHLSHVTINRRFTYSLSCYSLRVLSAVSTHSHQFISLIISHMQRLRYDWHIPSHFTLLEYSLPSTHILASSHDRALDTCKHQHFRIKK